MYRWPQYWLRNKANRRNAMLVTGIVLLVTAAVFFATHNHSFHFTIVAARLVAMVLILATVVLFFISARKMIVAKKTTLLFQRQQRLLAAVFSSLREAVLITDGEGDIVYINPAAEQLTGYSATGAFGKSVTHVCPIESPGKESFASIVSRVISEGSKADLARPCQLNSRDGRKVIVEGAVCPVTDSDGLVKRVVITLADATEQQTAQRKAYQREQLMRELIENIPAAVYTCDEFGYIQLYNKAAVKLWGREPVNGHEQWVGAWRLFTEDGEPIYGEESPMALTIQRKQRVNGRPVIVQRPDGSRRKVIAHPTPLFDETKHLYGAVNLLEDITDREAEQLLMHQTNEKYQCFIEQATDGVLLYSLDGTIFEFNAAACKLTGYTQDEFSRLRLQDILVGDVVANPANVERMMAGESILFTRQIRSKSGELLEAEINARMLPDHSFLAFVRDVTERKRAEEELRISEERYRHLFNNNSSCIYIWDIDTLQLLEVNETTREHYGYSDAELKTMTLLDLRAADQHASILEFVENVRKDPAFRQDGIWKHRKKNGQEIVMHITSHQIELRGKPARMSVAKDVTESVLLRQQLDKERIQKQRQITDAVIVAQENERQYIGRELHDNINQILASARLYLGLAKKEPVATPSFVEEADNLVNIAIAEIRAVSHSLIPPSISETALRDALEILMDQIRSATPLRIEADFSGADETLLSPKLKLNIYRIIQEQLNNIVKYAQAQLVELRLYRNEEQLLLLIKDDGIGFDPAVRTTGVGLLNIRTRASLFNGELDIASAPGSGCTLRVSFCDGFSEIGGC